MNVIWIDDQKERREAANNLKNSQGWDVNFIDVEDQDISKILTEIVSNPEPDLILIDHNLHEVATGVFKKGSSVAASIRDNWPECPIICVSGVNISEVDHQQKVLYEDIISIDAISEHYPQILSIADGFKQVRANRPTKGEDLAELLNVPDIDRINFVSVLPVHNWFDKTLAVSISRWVRFTLMARAGFLYDKLWLSTLIGIKESSFHKVEHLFADAEYTGIFSNENERRWWKSDALIALYENSDLQGLPWERGRGLKDITQEDFSVCHATGESFPETVAFVDSDPNAAAVPIKIRESDLHPDFPSLLFFEDLRLMRPAE
ncbi:hypothetical protein [Flavobacterium sp.]|uniref:hypothetical protein n=1 Tax=Flavobacterium sp. TaxID=239 RepID=UPI0039E5C4C7